MKIRIKYILSFLLGVLITSVVGVSATLMYNANQITYTKSNNQEVTLDNALNELYTTQNTTVSTLNTDLNKYKNINVTLTAKTKSKTYFGEGQLSLNDFKDYYGYFKITNKFVDQTTSCNVYGWSTSGVSLSVNTVYNVSDFSSIYANLTSNADNVLSTCKLTINFYN